MVRQFIYFRSTLEKPRPAHRLQRMRLHSNVADLLSSPTLQWLQLVGVLFLYFLTLLLDLGLVAPTASRVMSSEHALHTSIEFISYVLVISERERALFVIFSRYNSSHFVANQNPASLKQYIFIAFI